MNISIIGSRKFKDYNFLEETINNYLIENNINHDHIDYIVSGGAVGADSLGKLFADNHSIKTIIHYPDWDRYGNSAGFVRNELIINDGDTIFAFWDGKSKGTLNSIQISEKLKKELILELI